MKNEITVMEVSGESCANCFTLLPVVKKLTEERGLAFRHLEASKETAEEIARLNVDRVPAVLVLKNGEPFAHCTGYQPEEILEVWLDAKVEEAENE